MKTKLIITVFLLLTKAVQAQTQTYEGLQKINGNSSNVYYSENAKDRAIKISTDVAKAESYFQKQFNVKPNYTLLVLSPADWKKYAHPQAIYGIPHYLPDGRLVVASENNDFWKRNAPPIAQLPKELAEKMTATYTDKNGEINLTNAFDLLAIHELGHAFQSAAKTVSQRNWLSELLCNVLLHTYLADNDPKQLPYITVFTKTAVSSFPTQRLKFTKLEDFEANYNEIAKNYPDNYGWYQCRFHVTAGDIYDAGGASSMKKIWSLLLSQKQKLTDDELLKLLSTDVALQKAITNWNQ